MNTQPFSPVWLNGWVFVYELSGRRFESSCSHLNFRLRTCFEQDVPWYSGNYRVWIHSEKLPLHEKNISLLSCPFTIIIAVSSKLIEFFFHIVTAITYFWLKSKTYPGKVPVMKKSILKQSISFISIYVFWEINSIMPQYLYLTQLICTNIHLRRVVVSICCLHGKQI